MGVVVVEMRWDGTETNKKHELKMAHWGNNIASTHAAVKKTK